LGLICPEGPWIKVEGELYKWKEGEMVVFDDSKFHEAENPTDQQRVRLMVDFKK
jgi:aspartyl/asparaginyl beta-hydroxylase (cupin superfamily)